MKLPKLILWMFWAERVAMEERARFLEPVYFWEIEKGAN